MRCAWSDTPAARRVVELDTVSLGSFTAVPSGISPGFGGAPQGWVHFWVSDSLRKVGRHDEALGPLGLGVTQAERQGQHYYDAERQRPRAEILLDMDGNAVEEAEALFGHALEIARRQEAKTFELRATTGLARRWNHTTNEVADVRRGSRAGQGSPCLPWRRCASRMKHTRSYSSECRWGG